MFAPPRAGRVRLLALLLAALAVLALPIPARAATGVDLSANQLFGVDWAWGTPSLSALHANGVRFVAGYLSYDPGKDLSAGEIQALHHGGIPTVLVWETTAQRSLGGYAAGVADGQQAAGQARAVGEPASRPIFFAVDFDTTGQAGLIFPYFRGVNAGVGSLRAGAYGGLPTISALFDAHLIRYGWQTYAWSGGRWDPRAHLQQFSNDHFIDGVGVDFDRSTATDFGQWPLAVASCARARGCRHHRPAPHPSPTPPRPPAKPGVRPGDRLHLRRLYGERSRERAWLLAHGCRRSVPPVRCRRVRGRGERVGREIRRLHARGVY